MRYASAIDPSDAKRIAPAPPERPGISLFDT
jgi:hypothetical protein